MKRIVVIGAGFGGLEAVTHLDRMFRSDRDIEILLLSDQNYCSLRRFFPRSHRVTPIPPYRPGRA